MANIKDVARLAGVSHGTVSNVLNGTSHVSPETAKKVLSAIDKLGYVPTAAARNLKLNRSMNIAVILPRISEGHFSAMYGGIERVLADRGYFTHLMLSSEIPKKEQDLLRLESQQRADGIILMSCRPDSAAELLSDMNIACPVVFLERDAGKGRNFVGCDNSSAMRDFVTGLFSQDYGEIALICGPQEFSAESDFLEGFRQAFLIQGRPLGEDHIIVTSSSREGSFRGAVELFQSSFIPEAVICTSEELARGAEKALEFLKSYLSVSPEIIAVSDASWVRPDRGEENLLLKPSSRLGEAAAELLIRNMEDPDFREPGRILLTDTLRFRIPEEKRNPGETRRKTRLRLAMLEGAATRALLSLARDFEHRSGYALEIDQFPYEELYERLTDRDYIKNFDILQVDLPWMEEIVGEGTLLPLDPYLNRNLNFKNKIIPGALESYAYFSGSYYAIPFIFGTQLLFYRKDLFEDPRIQNQYYELHRSRLAPPATWDDYNTLAEFFTRACNPDSPVRYGTTLGGKDSSGAVCEVLPRIWGCGGDVFGSRGEVILHRPEAVRGLASYCRSFRYAPEGAAGWWWNDQADLFTRGEAAMMMLFVAHATGISDRHHMKIAGRIGYEIVPGRQPLLGGWSLGIHTRSREKDGAFEFLNWLSRASNAVPHMILGGANPSIHLYESSELRSVYPWLEKSLESYSLSRKRQIPRDLYPGLTERTFEKILGRNIHEALAGTATPEEALSRVRDALEGFRA